MRGLPERPVVQCPLWVISVQKPMSAACLLCRQERTSGGVLALGRVDGASIKGSRVWPAEGHRELDGRKQRSGSACRLETLALHHTFLLPRNSVGFGFPHPRPELEYSNCAPGL